MRSRGVSEVYFPGWGMTGRSWGAETCHCRMEQGECKSASDVAEGTAVGCPCFSAMRPASLLRATVVGVAAKKCPKQLANPLRPIMVEIPASD